MSSMGRAGKDFEDDDALENIAERVEELEDAGRRGLEIIQDGFNDLYDGLADESSRVLESVERNIEEHPWLSLVIGFGVGCLLGSALLRRR
jgi:ElaB/YqjD/DUF883 family membrane-anchored ribosome-binding protein